VKVVCLEQGATPFRTGRKELPPARTLFGFHPKDQLETSFTCVPTLSQHCCFLRKRSTRGGRKGL